MTTQEVIILNDAGDWTFERRTRTSRSGTTDRYSLSIRAEPIVNDFSAVNLGAKAAEAILDMIRKQHRSISEPAAPSTIRRRRQAAKELRGGGSARLVRGEMAGGSGKTQRRYVAARTKNDAPGTSTLFGSDSNLLLNGWSVRQNPKEGTWTINVPANRLDPETFNGGVPALQRFVARLAEHIPALRGVGIFEDAGFQRAVAESTPVRVLTAASGLRWQDLRSIARGAIGIARAGGLF